MSIEQNQQLLEEINSQDPHMMEAARLAHHYTGMFQNGELSKDEYIELVADIQRQINIREAMIELENLQRLNTAINGMINIAKLV